MRIICHRQLKKKVQKKKKGAIVIELHSQMLLQP